MGFPASYTELLLPKLFIHVLSLLGLLRKLISVLFRLLGLQDFLEPDIPWPNQADFFPTGPSSDLDPVSAAVLREILPVVKFSELLEPPESCAVCLYEFEADDEIRRLANCRHIFHRGCLDRWIGYGQRTCPLCRTVFIPADLRSGGCSDSDERIWEEDSEIFELLLHHGDSSSSSSSLLTAGS
ncbi:E3 ubiquitin-protein ligase RHA1B [Momordica charantia]|uniref:E3 ubiquitin-protein ligase RHA1B n=1 Tax=Momordica charantia TaxID=3673 RepID=A0A6J1E2N7_MOMCH|nr:E3 ubiquitin-protein ligase RHA1B [Momordica charantia]